MILPCLLVHLDDALQTFDSTRGGDREGSSVKLSSWIDEVKMIKDYIENFNKTVLLTIDNQYKHAV
jgi:hypothetical protein